MKPKYEDSIFINCPFDPQYKSLFNAIVFVIHDCGFVARCALEISNSAKNRLEKIMDIIDECKYGVHDISRTTPDTTSRLPRFNMPLELGIFLGCSHFGSRKHKEKVALIMDREKFRYQKFISDIAGQDIVAHKKSPEKAIKEIRDWLKIESKRTNLPGGKKIFHRYLAFQYKLPSICVERHITLNEMTFVDYSEVVIVWLEENQL